jgi:(p)ppGpp synthase/HD superfamily hydrolase
MVTLDSLNGIVLLDEGIIFSKAPPATRSPAPLPQQPVSVGRKQLFHGHGPGDDALIKGILHDTIEDSPPAKKVTKEMIAERFGR